MEPDPSITRLPHWEDIPSDNPHVLTSGGTADAKLIAAKFDLMQRIRLGEDRPPTPQEAR